MYETYLRTCEHTVTKSFLRFHPTMSQEMVAQTLHGNFGLVDLIVRFYGVDCVFKVSNVSQRTSMFP